MVSTLRIQLWLSAVMLTMALGAPRALAQTPPAEEIVNEIHALVLPPYDVNKDTPNTNYREEFFRQRREITLHRARLIGELYRSHPDHPSVADLLPERWDTMFTVEADYDAVFKETEELLKAHPVHPIARDAWQWRAMSAMMCFSRAESYDEQGLLDAVEEFVKRYPDDPQGSTMLYEAASFHVRDRERSIAIMRRIVKDYPRSGAAREAGWKLRQVDEIGKPFELKFTDAITEREISIESLAGKIVVIDFWATWCGPCVAEMPRMKNLYAKWQSQGVEFIGVSLDAPPEERGLETLKQFVKEQGIAWPQYYLGQGWNSDFSSQWGIDSIPCVFVVDHQGNLAACNVGDNLEETVENLMARRKAGAGG